LLKQKGKLLEINNPNLKHENTKITTRIINPEYSQPEFLPVQIALQ
jgi:hypothetical protein